MVGSSGDINQMLENLAVRDRVTAPGAGEDIPRYEFPYEASFERFYGPFRLKPWSYTRLRRRMVAAVRGTGSSRA